MSEHKTDNEEEGIVEMIVKLILLIGALALIGYVIVNEWKYF